MITHFKGFVYGVDASAMFAQAMSYRRDWLRLVPFVVVGLSTPGKIIKDGGPGVRNAILEIVGVMVGVAEPL